MTTENLQSLKPMTTENMQVVLVKKSYFDHSFQWKEQAKAMYMFCTTE